MISICVNFPDGIPIKLAPKKGVVCEGINDMFSECWRDYYLPPKTKYGGNIFVGANHVCKVCEK